MSLPLSPFRRAAALAVGSALGLDPEIFPVSAPPDPALGDVAVGCFPAAKLQKAAPAAVAERVAAAFTATPLLARATAAGPYVNFHLDRGALFGALVGAALAPTGERRLVPHTPGEGKTVCIDFSSPNIAKQLAYHHIRSTVLGQVLCRMHRALGYRVVGINHLGDWGTTFGMVIAAIKEWGEPTPFDIEAMNALYVRFRAKCKEDPTWEDKGRAWFKKLEAGDGEARALWQRIVDVSWGEFNDVYQLLGIRFDEIRGESAYEGAMARVIAELEQKGLTSISEDALVVDLSAEGMPPCLLKKKDGATLYATRDLAAAEYRFATYHFDKSLYVVDRGQSLHFKQLFTVLRKAGHDWASRCVHVPFGLVRIGGKKAGTRAGNVVLLKEVLAEAQDKIAERLAASNPELGEAGRANVARTVGIGALIFANVVSQRDKDVDFDLEQITSFEGDAGPYVQYAHARCASILRRAQAQGVETDGAALAGADLGHLGLAEEWALAKLCTDLGDECARAAESFEPHIVAHYLLALGAAFSRWYSLGNADPDKRVLCADPETRRARLALVAAVQATFAEGLGLLGMGAPSEM
jgi:arginyl-tRNA synthetase